MGRSETGGQTSSLVNTPRPSQSYSSYNSQGLRYYYYGAGYPYSHTGYHSNSGYYGNRYGYRGTSYKLCPGSGTCNGNCACCHLGEQGGRCLSLQNCCTTNTASPKQYSPGAAICKNTCEALSTPCNNVTLSLMIVTNGDTDAKSLMGNYIRDPTWSSGSSRPVYVLGDKKYLYYNEKFGVTRAHWAIGDKVGSSTLLTSSELAASDSLIGTTPGLSTTITITPAVKVDDNAEYPHLISPSNKFYKKNIGSPTPSSASSYLPDITVRCSVVDLSYLTFNETGFPLSSAGAVVGAWYVYLCVLVCLCVCVFVCVCVRLCVCVLYV